MKSYKKDLIIECAVKIEPISTLIITAKKNRNTITILFALVRYDKFNLPAIQWLSHWMFVLFALPTMPTFVFIY
jgi:hypothetical protein